MLIHPALALMNLPPLFRVMLLQPRAPVTTLACKEERQAALACFRESKGNAPGEIVLKCQQVTDDLDRCAALVREAAVSKIVSGSLKA